MAAKMILAPVSAKGYLRACAFPVAWALTRTSALAPPDMLIIIKLDLPGVVTSGAMEVFMDRPPANFLHLKSCLQARFPILQLVNWDLYLASAPASPLSSDGTVANMCRFVAVPEHGSPTADAVREVMQHPAVARDVQVFINDLQLAPKDAPLNLPVNTDALPYVRRYAGVAMPAHVPARLVVGGQDNPWVLSCSDVQEPGKTMLRIFTVDK